ncbi:hypothetical protein [Nocardia macrotermitis]|uniref:Uncharacterized protein n=1 Tax=Nocardia macrotermitis TaxID=2585198 RepID=A0A7K0CWQ0_9NOCA|nr:hypothetical protein [Nocardia macrotermitis]MQY17858.1 hypothetical protein [Nocardia macrotermitis]
MRVSGARVRKSLARFVAPAGLVVSMTMVAAPAATADTGYGGNCVLYPNDPAATVNSLRFNCSIQQQVQIFAASQRGDVPHGVTNGWVTSPQFMQVVAPPFWIGKTFYTGPDGGTLMNRVTGANIPGWPANVYSGPAITDKQPAWLLDYGPSITPQILDEIREVTPNVWFGYSWWRGHFQTTLLLTFVLTYP